MEVKRLIQWVLVGVILIGMWGWVPEAKAANFLYPLKLAGSGKNQYFVDQNNQPFMMVADAAWSMFANLNEADVQTYLADRAAKGFNVVLANLVEHQYGAYAPNNVYNVTPFTGKTTSGNYNMGTPNEAYFVEADKYIKWAADDGIVVLLAPTYLGWGCGSEGWAADIKADTDQNIIDYGHFLGQRYASYPNIIWVLGADAKPSDCGIDAKMREFVQAVKQYDTGHLWTTHLIMDIAPQDYWNTSADTWLNLSNIYSYGSIVSDANHLMSSSNFKPFFLLESSYERETDDTTGKTVTQLAIRQQAYSAVLSGGLLGQLFGNCPIWTFGASNGYCTNPSGGWQGQLNSTGSVAASWVGKLFMSRPFYKLVPDQTIVSGGSNINSARASDGSTAIIYSPNTNVLTANMTKIAGSTVKAWWFGPSNGATTLIGSYANTGIQTFTPPSGGTDWVLVLDNAALNFPAPGTLSNATPIPTIQITPTVTPIPPTPTETVKPGDANGDGKVDGVDYTYWLLNYGSTTATGPIQGDFNGDKKTDGVDYAIWLLNYGS